MNSKLMPKMAKAKNAYDSLTSQYRELLELRYPEKKEERVNEDLYRAYCSVSVKYNGAF